MEAKQGIKKERTFKGNIIPLLWYEARRLSSRSVIPLIVIFIGGFLLSNIFLKFPLMNLSQTLWLTIQNTIIHRIYGITIPLGIGPFGVISDELLNALAFIPFPLRDYVALILADRSYIFNASSDIINFLTMSVTSITFLAMLFTSTITEEDLYPLIRVDRNKLLFVRSIMNVSFYTLVSVLVIFFLKYYFLLNDFWVSIVYPVLDALTPVLSLLPSIFLFLLLLQSFGVLINLHFPKAVYLLPSLLLMEIGVIKLPTVMMSASESSYVVPLWLTYAISMGDINSIQFFMPFLLFLVIRLNSLFTFFSTASYFLFLYHLEGLIHTFSPLLGGVWNLSLFDPQYAFQTILLQAPDIVILNPAYQQFLPYPAIITIMTESLKNPVYSPWFNYFYITILPLYLYWMTATQFAEKTL